MDKNYNTSYMYKVFFVTRDTREVKDSYFPDKETAYMFIDAMKERGIECHLNNWSWEVKVEN